MIDYAFNLQTLTQTDINLAVRQSLEKPLILKRLISHGADVNSDHGTPLTGASQEGILESVKILVENGADIHSRGDLALTLAVYNNHLDVAKYLVQQGADYNLPLYPNYITRNDTSGYIRFIQNNTNRDNLILRRNREAATQEIQTQIKIMEEEEKAMKDTTPLNKDIIRKILYTKYKEELCHKLDRKSLYVLYEFAFLLGIQLNGTETREEVCRIISENL
jgi:hypothetical protein